MRLARLRQPDRRRALRRAQETGAKGQRPADPQTMASLCEFGWTNPVLIDEKNNMIAGHSRVEAARRLGTESPDSSRTGSIGRRPRASDRSSRCCSIGISFKTYRLEQQEWLSPVSGAITEISSTSMRMLKCFLVTRSERSTIPAISLFPKTRLTAHWSLNALASLSYLSMPGPPKRRQRVLPRSDVHCQTANIWRTGRGSRSPSKGSAQRS